MKADALKAGKTALVALATEALASLTEAGIAAKAAKDNIPVPTEQYIQFYVRTGFAFFSVAHLLDLVLEEQDIIIDQQVLQADQNLMTQDLGILNAF